MDIDKEVDEMKGRALKKAMVKLKKEVDRSLSGNRYAMARKCMDELYGLISLEYQMREKEREAGK